MGSPEKGPKASREEGPTEMETGARRPGMQQEIAFILS